MTDALRLHDDPPTALSYRIDRVDEVVPDELAGTLLRVGSGVQHVGGGELNLFDGYGMVAAVSFEPGSYTFRSAHVETPAWQHERAAVRHLMRRAFTNKHGTLPNAFDLSVAKLANHDIYPWAGYLVATDTAGHTLLDPFTLRTVGASPLDALKQRFGSVCPMPRIDPVSGHLVAFLLAPSIFGDVLTFVELDAEWKVVAKSAFPTGAHALVLHDLAFTSKWYVALELGCLHVGAALTGRKTIWDCIGPLEGGHRRLFFAPRGHEHPPFHLDLPAGTLAFHVVNAYEDGNDEQIILDLVVYQTRPDLGALFPPGHPARARGIRDHPSHIVRAVANLRDRVLSCQMVTDVTAEAPCIHPKLHGQKHRYTYFAAQTSRGDEDLPNAYFYFHGIGRVDFKTGENRVFDAGPRAFCSPPAFVAKPNAIAEDDAWLLSWVLDAEAGLTKIVVLEAARVEEGPVATLWLKHGLPAVSHVEFCSTVFSD